MKVKLVTLVIVATITFLHVSSAIDFEDYYEIYDYEEYDEDNEEHINLTKPIDHQSEQTNPAQKACTCPKAEVTNDVPLKGQWTSPGYPNAYPPSCECKYPIEVRPGYNIDIFVENLKLDSSAGDYLNIHGGIETDSHEKGYILTSNLVNRTKLKIIHNHKAFMKFVSTDSSDGTHTGFSLTFEESGTLTTTKPPTTTMEPLPTSATDGTRPEIMVNLTGMTPIEMDGIKEDFKDKLATHANLFFKDDAHIQQYGQITSDNVLITLIRSCPRHWPDKGPCAQVQFSIPIVTKNTNSSTTPMYELSFKNLNKLWKSFASAELKTLKLVVYETPDDAYYLSLWMGAALGTLALVLISFLGILYCIWKSAMFKDYFSVGSDATNSNRSSFRTPGEYDIGLEPNSKHGSGMALHAPPHQLVPAFFGDEMEQRAPDMTNAYHDLDHGLPYGYPPEPPSYRTSEETGTSSDQTTRSTYHDIAAFVSDEPVPATDSNNPQNHRNCVPSRGHFHIEGGIYNESMI